MDQFRRIVASDNQNIIKFLKANYWNCLNIVSSYMKHGFTNNKSAKDSGELYGYFRDKDLHGLFLFSNNNCFYPFCDHPGVLKKVDLLRTIKYYKPIVIEGEKSVVDAIWKIIDRTIVWSDYKACSLMYIDDQSKMLVRESSGLEDQVAMVSPIDVDINSHTNFFVTVEKHFGHNYKTVNQLKEKIMDKANQGQYILAMIDDQIIGQALIEKNIGNFAIISGIYTLPKYRGKGYGRLLTEQIVKNILAQDMVPVLTVENKNHIAKGIYETLGFTLAKDYVIAEVRF